VPVPLHQHRLRARGYNQAAVLAAELAARLRRPLVAGLARVLDSPPQVGQGGEGRRVALQQAFRWEAAAAPPIEVLLIDDVVTTGATLLAAARALKEAGAARVHALAIALG
jgi:predicted amidophosphoribosyltransferase